MGNSISYYIENHICLVCGKKANTYQVENEGYFIECPICTPFHFGKNIYETFIKKDFPKEKRSKVSAYIRTHNKYINMAKLKSSDVLAAKYIELHYPSYKDFADADMETYFSKWSEF